MKYRTIFNAPKTRATITEPWIYWDDGLTPDELDRLVEYCQRFELQEGTTFEHDNELEVNEQRRKSLIKFHHRTDENGWMFDKLNFIITAANEQFYNFDLNGYECFQYTEYHAEQQGYYDWHMDMCLSHDNANLCETRKLSVTLCLNDDYEGGEFMINASNEKDAITVPTKKGRAILFPSWMLHKVAPVTKGVRRSLVIWVMGPKWI